jgi:hypothetical protein
MNVRTPIAVLWVCDCCLFAAEADGCEHHQCDREPWNLIPDGDVTCGLLSEEHECGRETGDGPEECDCESREFSRSTCDGCGQPLAGSRSAFTQWQRSGVTA